jgi:hypothetical protein
MRSIQLLTVAALCLAGRLPAADTQDATGPFDPAADAASKKNPAGTWTFGFTTAEGTFQAHDLGSFDYETSSAKMSVNWSTKNPAHHGTSIEMANTKPKNGLLFPPGQLCFVSNMANKTGERPTLRWTAPGDGTVLLSGTMAGVGLSTHGMMGTRGPAGIFPSNMDGKWVAGKDVLFNASLNEGQTGNSAEFNVRRAVKRGEVIDLVCKSRKSDKVCALTVKMKIAYVPGGTPTGK